MRNALVTLVLVGLGILAFFALVPALLLVLVAVVGIVVLVLALPLLAKLPWFRDRIIVHRGTWPPPPPPQRPPGADQGDVIDVEGRELPPDSSNRVGGGG